MDPQMDERQRRARELDALELIVGELEKLRILKEHELGVRIEDVGGDLFVESAEK